MDKHSLFILVTIEFDVDIPWRAIITQALQHFLETGIGNQILPLSPLTILVWNVTSNDPQNISQGYTDNEEESHKIGWINAIQPSRNLIKLPPRSSILSIEISVGILPQVQYSPSGSTKERQIERIGLRICVVRLLYAREMRITNYRPFWFHERETSSSS